MINNVFMIDQVKPKHKFFIEKRKTVGAFGFELCIAVFLVIAISIVF